jgi:hypothetical protein
MQTTEQHAIVGDAVMVTGVDALGAPTLLYGWLAAGPPDQFDSAFGAGPGLLLHSQGWGYYVIDLDEEVTPVSGCECGNPFVLCHPDA